MCFSAEASFAAGAVLCTAGIWTRALAHTPAERPLATIPLLFGLQQFAEGVVWVGFGNRQPELVSVFSYFFVFFAFFLWPLLVPLAVLLVEPDRTRKRIQETALIIGVCVAVFICGSLTRYPLATEILEGHIAYRMHLPLLHESLALYFAAVSAPCFSSYREIRWFGLGLLGALGLSLLRDTLEFVSLWCFAAALLSGLLTWHFKSSGAADQAAVRTP